MLLSLKMIYETTKRQGLVQGLGATAAPRAPAASREPGARGARPAKVTPQNHGIHESALPGLPPPPSSRAPCASTHRAHAHGAARAG